MRTQEKELLLQDLCARLPYGVIVNVKGFDYDYNDKLTQIYKGDGCSIQVTTNMPYDIEQVKPYLFPLSSMTEEQKKDFDSVLSSVGLCYAYDVDNSMIIFSNSNYNKNNYISDFYKIEVWLNKNHFDYRNLIDKNLAIDATNLNIY